MRPRWFFRLAATTVDLGCVGGCLGLLPRHFPVFILVVLLAYYICFERWMGRTPGKILFLMRYQEKNLSWKQIVWRNVLRIVLFPIASLAWNRVTLLDALTGLRLQNHFANKHKSENIQPTTTGWR